jgi:hypothetical protein
MNVFCIVHLNVFSKFTDKVHLGVCSDFFGGGGGWWCPVGSLALSLQALHGFPLESI